MGCCGEGKCQFNPAIVLVWTSFPLTYAFETDSASRQALSISETFLMLNLMVSSCVLLLGWMKDKRSHHASFTWWTNGTKTSTSGKIAERTCLICCFGLCGPNVPLLCWKVCHKMSLRRSRGKIRRMLSWTIVLAY